MVTGAAKTTLKFGKILNHIIKARAATFRGLTQDVTVGKHRMIDVINGTRAAALELTQDIALRKQKVMDVIKEKYEVASNTQVGQKLRILKEYWRVEMAPPSSTGEIQQLKDDLNLAITFMRSGGWKHLTVKQLWLMVLVSVEVGLWFYLGETFGKMSFVGYKV